MFRKIRLGVVYLLLILTFIITITQFFGDGSPYMMFIVGMFVTIFVGGWLKFLEKIFT